MVVLDTEVVAQETILNQWKSRGLPDWSVAYNRLRPENTPWHFSHLDPDLAHALSLYPPADTHLLDVGCGYGAQTHALTQAGYSVLGTDISAKAIADARVLYPSLHFAVDDILHTHLDYAFGGIWDRGCFHVMEPENRNSYIAQLHRLLLPSGKLFLKCMSSKAVNKKLGPFLFSEEELFQYFSAGFNILSMEDTVYQSNLNLNRKALFAVMEKR